MKKLLLTITTSFFLINSTHVEAREYSDNEYKKFVCEEFLYDAVRWAETQERIDNAIDKRDTSFWRAYKKLVNRCKSYKNNTVKTIEKDYTRLYAEYWD